MKWNLIRARIHQIKRELEQLGILYTFIILIFLCILIFYVYLFYLQKNESLIIFITTVFALLLLHVSRKDKEFIFRQIDHPVENIFAEYFIFTLPITIPPLFTSHWFYFPLLIILFYFIANIKVAFKHRTVLPHLSKIIPAANFEWISGLRKGLIIMLLGLVFALITCWIRIAPLVFLWLITTSVASFYQESESLQILYASSISPKKLLKKKIVNSSAFLLIIFIPILVINSIFNPEMILINIIFLIIQITILIFAILLKYTTYTPNEDLKGNSILLIMVSIGSFIPFLLPIPIIMCFRNYGKAVRNLKFYFND